MAGIVPNIGRRLRTFILTSAVAAGWLWALLAYPFSFRSPWSLAGHLGLLLAFLLPPIILTGFLRAVRTLERLPERTRRLNEQRRASTGHLTSAARSGPPRRRLWGIGRALYDLWRLVYESRDTLLEYTALARLATPVTFLVLAGAAVGCLAIIATALAGTLWVVAF